MSSLGEALTLIADDLDATRHELRNRDEQTLLLLRSIADSQKRIEKMLLETNRSYANLEQDLETHKRFTSDEFAKLRKKPNGQLAPA